MTAVTRRTAAVCPFALEVSPVAAFLNCEIADHPVYDGLELQRFDDDVHGTGFLAFLSRRVDRRVDYYVDPGLRLDRTTYAIGGGTGAWVPTEFPAARLDIAPDGVVADVAFTDVDGRRVEVDVDDRDGRRRRHATVLAPVGAGIDHPESLMLVVMRRFDLVRTSGRTTVRIDGTPVATGRLPLDRIHRRRLVKVAAALSVAMVNRTHDGPVRVVEADAPDVALTAAGITELTADGPGTVARLAFAPPFPDVTALEDGEIREGRWLIDVDAATHVTGGTWTARRHGDVGAVDLAVTDRWHPPRRPLLMAVVTRAIGVFRRWPTTYRWSGRLDLGVEPTLRGGWRRTAGSSGASYRRVTGSG